MPLTYRLLGYIIIMLKMSRVNDVQNNRIVTSKNMLN